MQNYLLILFAGAALLIAGFSLRRTEIPSSVHLTVLASVSAFWSLMYLLHKQQILYFPTLLFVALYYLFSALAASTLFTFSLAYSSRITHIPWLALALLVIEPAITQVLFWIESTRVKYFLETDLLRATGPFGAGLWVQINTVYLYSLELASLLLLVDVISRKPRTLFFQSGTLLIGAFSPFIIRFINAVDPTAQGLDDFIGYFVAAIGFALGLYRPSIVEAVPVTYESVIKGMSDGWMVLDINSNIIEINPAAEKIVGLPRRHLYGKPIQSILPDWPDISNISAGGKELEMRRSVLSQGSWRYLNVRLSNLRDNKNKPFGQLIVWRDITDRKLAEESRQRARDEMFVLLNAISNAASHSIKLEDFLSESIYQIIYPFQSQVVAIFLIEEPNESKQRMTLRLAAQFGLVSDGLKDINEESTHSWIINEFFSLKQPLVIENAQKSFNIPASLQDTKIASLVVLQLFTQAGENSRLLGVMLLGRNDVSPYGQDEVIRLMAIAEQIANLIDSDRRRQLAIALSEREKLMRDLHDSVSQKLYGLLTLTEAAQAGLEAGSKVIPSQVLGKIGENARQAVKEMRLFLYQMQPVDLEKGGLVSALHHRLGAVEGRADLQARFLPDESISISKEKEVALYYIAQEALNNILKHAHATSVLVKLRQTRQNILLEIIDNGDGFDLKNVDQSGMGLQNMKARTAQVNGKLKIITKPRAGTTIQVMVDRERFANQKKNKVSNIKRVQTTPRTRR